MCFLKSILFDYNLIKPTNLTTLIKLTNLP